MESIRTGKVAGIISECLQLNFIRSLDPIFCTLRIFGIDLEVNRPRYRRYASVLLGTLFVLLNGVSHSYMVFKGPELFYMTRAAENVYLALHFLLTAFFSTLFILTLLLRSHFKWADLWKKLQKVEQFNHSKTSSYRKIHRGVRAALLLFVLLVISSFGTFQF